MGAPLLDAAVDRGAPHAVYTSVAALRTMHQRTASPPGVPLPALLPHAPRNFSHSPALYMHTTRSRLHPYPSALTPRPALLT